MLVVRTTERRTDPFRQLVGAEQAVGLHDARRLPCTHFLGSIGLSQGLFLGNKQLMILNPPTVPFFTARLCSPIHRRTCLLTCPRRRCVPHHQYQEDPLLAHLAAASLSEHHERRTGWLRSRSPAGRPSTKRSHVCCPSSGRYNP